MTDHKTNNSEYKFNHTMLRVKDPKKSIEFYELLGMKKIKQLDFDDSKFSLIFLGYCGAQSESGDNHWTDREGLIELTHNHGSENDADFKIANGNTDPHKGFGHVCISVDNIESACERLEKSGVRFQKKLKDGRMHNIAFALDPDDYWVEIISLPEDQRTDSDTNVETYRMNHSMIRVKDPKKSLTFYSSVIGLSLLRRVDFEGAKFSLYFLGYRRTDDKYDSQPALDEKEGLAKNTTGHREGLLELTHNWGTESDDSFKGYHDGNSDPKGFGHIGVSVDDLDAACSRLEDLNVNWKKRLTDGSMKDVAFILDPDGYSVEIIQNERMKKRAAW